MSDRNRLHDKLHLREVKQRRKLSKRRTLAWTGAGGVAFLLVVCMIVLVFGNVILNRYAKGKAERLFDKAHPGCSLRIGELDYTVGANRLAAQSVTLSSASTIFKSGRISLTGVRWTRLLTDTVALADVLANTSLDATNLNVEFPEALYRIRCARLRASVPKSESQASS